MKKVTKFELQTIQIEILSEIDQLCRINKLNYFISYGTLIGAIRHKGFIPWDDDIDICMLRDDYNKFINIIKKNEKYRFISMETDPDYYFTFGRLCDKNTFLILKGYREVHNFGVFVDIFPIDVAPPDFERDEWIKKFRYLKRKIFITTPSSAKYQEHSIKTISRRLYWFPYRILYGTRNFEKYRKELYQLMTYYNNNPSDDFLSAETYLQVRKVFKFKWISETIDVPFENIIVKAPVGYDEMLRAIYGNYLELPPVEQRVSHHRFTAYWK